jgi:BirA family transcriptional regulator, biotin operon repressor / biotin---[acetyl-CoA-carboxylase] ligase
MSFSPAQLVILESVDSTNNYAMAMVQNGTANSGDAVFAMDQSHGKGRRDKTWKSKRGENILLTVLAQMQWLSLHEQFRLSMAVALACHDFFSQYIKENVKIKWPNDIFINDSKAGGILIENQLKGNLWQWAIIGMGLNINQEKFEKDILKATSLTQITGERYNVIKLSGELHAMVLKRLSLLQSRGSTDMLNEYNQNLFCRNKAVKLKKGNIAFETEIESVSASGELITKDTIERSFRFDEVQWINL